MTQVVEAGVGLWDGGEEGQAWARRVQCAVKCEVWLALVRRRVGRVCGRRTGSWSCMRVLSRSGCPGG